MTRNTAALTLAHMICDLTEANMSPHEFALVRAGTNPHDIIDANVAVYGAWAGLYFEESDAGDQKTADLMNAATELCLAHGYDRVTLRAMLYLDETDPDGPLTVSQFAATAKHYTADEGADILRVEPSFFEPSDKIVIYASDCYSTILANGKHWAHVSRDEYEGDAAGAAAFVYFEHYVHECIDPEAWTRASLRQLQRDFGNYEHRDPRNLLDWLSERWAAIIESEYAANVARSAAARKSESEG
jgi:hypothetical protein